jgi:hypothetical protein
MYTAGTILLSGRSKVIVFAAVLHTALYIVHKTMHNTPQFTVSRPPAGYIHGRATQWPLFRHKHDKRVTKWHI